MIIYLNLFIKFLGAQNIDLLYNSIISIKINKLLLQILIIKIFE